MTLAQAWLKNIRALDDDAARKAERIMRLRAKLECPRSVLSDMPRGGGCNDWSVAMDMLIDLEREADEAVDRVVDAKQEAGRLIGGLPDERMRDILRMRYVEFCGWDAISRELGDKCAARTMYYLHDKAIEILALQNLYIRVG